MFLNKYRKLHPRIPAKDYGKYWYDAMLSAGLMKLAHTFEHDRIKMFVIWSKAEEKEERGAKYYVKPFIKTRIVENKDGVLEIVDDSISAFSIKLAYMKYGNIPEYEIKVVVQPKDEYLFNQLIGLPYCDSPSEYREIVKRLNYKETSDEH